MFAAEMQRWRHAAHGMFAVLKMPSAFAFFEEAKTKDVKRVSVP